MRNKRTTITPELENKVITLRAQSLPLEDIAALLLINIKTANKICKKYNINYRVDGISEEYEKIIINYLQDGYFINKIASFLPFNESSINKFLKRNNYVKIGRSYSSGLTKEQELKIIDLINNNYSLVNIYNIIGITLPYIKTFCKNLSITSKHKNRSGKITKEISNQILELQKQGFNSVQIAEVFDINRNSITNFARKSGTPFKRTKELTDEQRIELEQCKRLRKNFSKAIHRVLREREDINKYHSLSDYLTYTVKELKEHIESQFESWMTWDNWGVYSPVEWDDSDQSTWKWHIDHVVPISKFIYTSMQDEEFKKCWALDNLRPLSAKQNVHDGATKVRHT